MRLRHLAATLVAAVALAAAACGGGKCDRCSADSDCDDTLGYICERYEDGVHRCGDPTRRFDVCEAE